MHTHWQWIGIVVAAAPAIGQGALDAGSEGDTRAIVAAMLADAGTRSSVLQSGPSAGHDGGFFIQSADGAFRLSAGGVLQFRYAYNHLTGSGEDDESGFFFPRVRLWLNGTGPGPLSYRVRGQFSGSNKEGFAEERTIGGFFELDQAWANIKLSDHWGLRLGQQSSEFSRENDLAPQDQLGVNASPTDSVFGFGGYQGVRLAYQGDDARLFLTFSDGMRNKNSDYDDPRNADFALTAKGDWLIAGEWSRFGDFTSRPGSEFAMMLGSGIHWENGADVGDPARNLSLLGAIAELSLEGNGWSLYSAFHYFRNTFLRTGDEHFDDYGLVVQGSLYLTDRIEPFVRFDAVFADADRPERNQDFRTITAGLNYYPFPGSSAVKASLDVMYMLDDEADALVNPSSNTGVQASTGDDQLAFRAQVTVVF